MVVMVGIQWGAGMASAAVAGQIVGSHEIPLEVLLLIRGRFRSKINRMFSANPLIIAKEMLIILFILPKIVKIINI